MPTANLLTGLGVDEIFTRTDAAGTANFLADALASTLALTDATGTVATQYTYEPFGNTTVSGLPSANPYQYTGRENDGTGLYYYRARYYNPSFQRFISQDPLEFAAGDTNLYAYTYNSPLNFRDPTGMQSGTAAGCLVAGPAGCAGGALVDILLWAGLGTALAFTADAIADALRAPKKPKEKCEKVAKCYFEKYDRQLGGCIYYCDDGMTWFTPPPCERIIYKPWGEGVPWGPPLPTAP